MLLLLVALAHSVVRAKSLSKQTKQSLDQRPVDPDCRALCVRRLQHWPRPKCKTACFKLIWAIPSWHFESSRLGKWFLESLMTRRTTAGSKPLMSGHFSIITFWCQISFLFTAIMTFFMSDWFSPWSNDDIWRQCQILRRLSLSSKYSKYCKYCK